MKNIKNLLFGLAVLALASCAKETSVQESSTSLPDSSSPAAQVERKVVTFSAEMPDYSSKTYLGDKLQVLWSEGDKIAVYDGTGWIESTSMVISEGGKKAQFTVAVAAADTYYAVFPAGCQSSTPDDEGNFTVSVPSEQTIDGQNIDKSALVAVSKSTGSASSFGFKSVTSLAKINFTGNVTDLSISANGGELFSGKTTVNAETGVGTAVSAEASSSVKLAGTLEQGTDYYVSVIPATAAKGLTMTFTRTGESASEVGVLSKSSSVEFVKTDGVNLGTPYPTVWYTPIYDKADLDAFGSAGHSEAAVSGNYILMADIDYESGSWQPVREFTGTFNGNGYSISNMTIGTLMPTSSSSDAYANFSSFISCLSGSGVIKNLTLDSSCSITTAGSNYDGSDIYYVSGITGCMTGTSKLSNCVNNAGVTVSSDFAHAQVCGGLVGYIQTSNGTISNCTNKGAIAFNSSTVDSRSCGGIAGEAGCDASDNISVSFTDCTNSGAITLNGTYLESTGGILGHGFIGTDGTTTASFTGCKNSGAMTVSKSYVKGTSAAYKFPAVGGIAGFAEKAVFNFSSCSNSAKLLISTAPNSYTRYAMGGIVGQIGTDETNGSASTITSCTNSGTLTQSVSSSTCEYCGGIAGKLYNSGAVIDGCTNKGTLGPSSTYSTSANHYYGGICGGFYLGTIKNSDNNGNVRTNDNKTGAGIFNIGGIVSYMADGNIDNCNQLYSKGIYCGTSTGNGSINRNVGGIVGKYGGTTGKITNCEVTYPVSYYIASSVKSSKFTEYSCGGVIGYVSSKTATGTIVSGCTVNSAVTGQSAYTGMVVGWCLSAATFEVTIKNGSTLNSTAITAENMETYAQGTSTDNKGLFSLTFE